MYMFLCLLLALCRTGQGILEARRTYDKTVCKWLGHNWGEGGILCVSYSRCRAFKRQTVFFPIKLKYNWNKG